MGFNALDDLINEMTVNGKFFRADWNKNTFATTAQTAGAWYSLFRGLGNPTADTIFGTGTNKLFQPLSDATANATGIPHGGNVYPDTKHILNASAWSAAATSMPCVFMLVDLLGFYNITTVTTTGDQAMTNTLSAFSTFTADASLDTVTLTNNNLRPLSTVQVSSSGTLPAGLAAATNYFVISVTDSVVKLATSYANAVAGTAINITDAGTGTHTLNTLLPRYTNGAGVQAFLTPSTVMGAGTPNLRLTYTDSENNAGNLTPTTLPVGLTASPVTNISYSGTGVGKYGPFFPLAIGDKGIRLVEQYNQSATWTSGVQNLVLCKPLLTLPMTTIGVPGERDCLNQVPSLPRIFDGACLAWLMYAGAATPVNSAFAGHIDVAWG